MDHPTEIDGFELEELAEKIGDLRYDALAAFLSHLGAKLSKDSNMDHGRRRHKMASFLSQAAEKTSMARGFVHAAWEVAKPYMKE